jgi:hypothetical protein
MMTRVPAVLALAGLTAACGSTPTHPAVDSLTIGPTGPSQGAVVAVPEQYPYIVPGDARRP